MNGVLAVYVRREDALRHWTYRACIGAETFRRSHTAA